MHLLILGFRILWTRLASWDEPLKRKSSMYNKEKLGIGPKALLVLGKGDNVEV